MLPLNQARTINAKPRFSSQPRGGVDRSVPEAPAKFADARRAQSKKRGKKKRTLPMLPQTKIINNTSFIDVKINSNGRHGQLFMQGLPQSVNMRSSAKKMVRMSSANSHRSNRSGRSITSAKERNFRISSGNKWRDNGK